MFSRQRAHGWDFAINAMTKSDLEKKGFISSDTSKSHSIIEISVSRNSNKKKNEVEAMGDTAY